MSGPTEVSPSAPVAEPTLRVRPPSPLSTGRRLAVAIGAVAVVVVGAVLVQSARSADGGTSPGARWRAFPPPRAAAIDPFEVAGALGVVAPVDGFGTWNPIPGGWTAADGLLRSPSGLDASKGIVGFATVDAGSSDVLVYAQFVHAETGSGLLLSAGAAGVPGLRLVVVDGVDQWELVSFGAAQPETLARFTAPVDEVVVQVVRQGDTVKVTFGDQASDVDLPGGAPDGTHVGVVAGGPGTQLDLFGYLRLDAG